MATSGETSEVLFQRGVNDGDESMWDDTALIKAYDQAVNPLKMAVNDSPLIKTSKPKQKHQKKAKRHKTAKNKETATRNWQVGDRCQAIFSEDGYLYEAIITSLDSTKRTCIIKYQGYGNEEEQNLGDLLPVPSKDETSANNISETESDLPSEIEGVSMQEGSLSSASSVRSASVCSRKSKEQNHVKTSGVKHDYHDRTASFSMPFDFRNSIASAPPPPAFPFTMPGIPPMFPGVLGGMPSSNFPPPPVVPVIPPPILPDSESITDDKDALYGMLIAWYMSGYHTGYYQCMKQMQKTQKSDTEANSTTSSVPLTARGQSKPSKQML